LPMRRTPHHLSRISLLPQPESKICSGRVPR
jgi:hypothetical protein